VPNIKRLLEIRPLKAYEIVEKKTYTEEYKIELI